MNTLIEKLKKLARIFYLTPADPRINLIAKMLHSKVNASKNTNQVRVALQAAEDVIYFGLFGCLLIDLQKKIPLKIDLLQVKSINRFIGKGFIATISRSWLIGHLSNLQWFRAYSFLHPTIAYRCQKIWPYFLYSREYKLANQLWHQMKLLNKYEDLSIDGIKIGDLVIDSYLRVSPSPKFNVEDKFVLDVLCQAIHNLRLSIKYFKYKRPNIYFATYSTYLEHGIAIRVALSLGVVVRVYPGPIAFGKRLKLEDVCHHVDTSAYRAEFEKIESKDECYKLASIELEKRFSGVIDPATTYMKVSAYAEIEDTMPEVSGGVIIFLHDFYDSPHTYPDLIFTDFWEWAIFTIQFLTDSKIPFWIKPHPNQIQISLTVLDEIKRLFPNAPFISANIRNTKLVAAGISCGVTVYGTVAHELAYLGVPTIGCAKHPHFSFDFCRTAKNIDDYKEMLLNHNLRPLDQVEMKKQACAFYYMHNLHGSKDFIKLRKAFSDYWRKCEHEGLGFNSVSECLSNLRKSPGWSEHINHICNDVLYLRP